MRGSHPKLFGVLWFLFVITIITLAFVIAFIITNTIFQLTHIIIPPLLTQIINSFLGLFLTGMVFGLFSRFFRQQQFNAFQPIIQAMERIARGDFSIRLENEHTDGIISGLVDSVNKMALELGQMENMRQEFISNVSHEIQSPLTSIHGFAQALRDDKLSATERHHYLEIIELESKRLSRLTDDLLKLASLDADQVKFEPKPYRLDKQIRSTILTCEPQWRDKALDLEIDLTEVWACADEDLLNQVWMNLLHNAIKFTPQGGKISISLHPHGEQVEFCVADSGIGISDEERIHIFERFYKADKSRTSVRGGSGLGLSIVKRIVEMHRGQIEVESTPGAGAKFTIHLPIGL